MQDDGLHQPWHPGSWRPMVGFLSMCFEKSLALKSRKGRTGARKDMIQVVFPVFGFGPWREGRQLIGFWLV